MAKQNQDTSMDIADQSNSTEIVETEGSEDWAFNDPLPRAARPVNGPPGISKLHHRQVIRTSLTSNSSGKTGGINLGLSSRPFYGRKQEMDQLSKAYRESISSTVSGTSGTSASPCRAVLIKGVCGTGKTALVQQFVQLLTDHDNFRDDNGNILLEPLVLQGKFEEMKRQDPFSALEQAFGNFVSDQVSSSTCNTTCSHAGSNVTTTRTIPSSGSAGATSANSDGDPARAWKEQILEDIGGETGLGILKDIIPTLSSWLQIPHPDNQADTSSDVSDTVACSEDSCSLAPRKDSRKRKNASVNKLQCEVSKKSFAHSNDVFKSNQLHHVFGQFIKALTKTISSRRRPLLLVQEDLQWCDQASFDLINYLISSPLENFPFFFIGTYRANDASKHTPVIDKLKEESYHSVLLRNHSREEITECLSRELKCNAFECQVLTSAIYEKTEGNILFTLHVVEELQRHGVLRTEQRQRQSSTATTYNSWDNDDILQFVEQSRTQTVVDTIADKIQHLANPQVKQIVVLASYLGSKFDCRRLFELGIDIAKDDTFQPSMTQHELVNMLDVAVLEGLLRNDVGSFIYEFAHDGIHEAAYNMVPAGAERDQLLYRIGHFLRAQALKAPGNETSNTDWMLFLAARHWGEIGDRTYVDPLELAVLCKECGSKAKSMTAFLDAAQFFQRALDSLLIMQGVDLWASHYDLTLQIYESSAQMELLLGNFEKGTHLAQVVLLNANALVEKFPTYYALDMALGLQDRHDEALALNMEVLAELKETPSTLMGIRDFFTVKRLINETSDEEVLALPETTDPYQLATIRCIGNVAVRSFCCGKPLLMVAATLKQVKCTLTWGLCSDSPVTFAGFGCALLSGMGHPATGRRMAKLARKIIKERKFSEQECKTLYLLASLIEIWMEPFDAVIDTYKRGYEIGLASGISDFAFACEVEGLTVKFMAGKPLEMIAHKLRGIKKQVEQYNLKALKKVLAPFETLVFCLRGVPADENSSQAALTQIDWDELASTEERNEGNHYTLTWMLLDRMILAYSMGNAVLATRMCKRFHENAPEKSFFFCTLGSFYSSLIHANLAHTTRLSRHKHQTRKFMKDLKKCVAKGCAKASHRYAILKAEFMSISKPQKQSLVQKQYDEAIAFSKENKCVNDQALASELAGEYFLRQKRPHTAKQYLAQACALYREWGAYAKVDQLLKNHEFAQTVDDLPNVDVIPEILPVINCLGALSRGTASVSDDVSALTPIPENGTLSNDDRWHSGAGSCQEAISAAPRPPQRPSSTKEEADKFVANYSVRSNQGK